MLIRKLTLKTNIMDRFENHVLLDVAFTHIQTQESYPGKDNTLSGYFIKALDKVGMLPHLINIIIYLCGSLL